MSMWRNNNSLIIYLMSKNKEFKISFIMSYTIFFAF